MFREIGTFVIDAVRLIIVRLYQALHAAGVYHGDAHHRTGCGRLRFLMTAHPSCIEADTLDNTCRLRGIDYARLEYLTNTQVI
jgi:hypothetical protein